ncbi:MAG: hypothetical protein ACYCZ7_02075 [Minisyncoccota bacterium]
MISFLLGSSDQWKKKGAVVHILRSILKKACHGWNSLVKLMGVETTCEFPDIVTEKCPNPIDGTVATIEQQEGSP